MLKRNYTFSQINAYAMLHGVTMGLWGLMSIALFIWNLIENLEIDFIILLTFLLSPFIAYKLTTHYRSETSTQNNPSFTITQGFLHAFLTMFYGSLWVALGVYVYMAYFENGAITDAYLAYFARPEIIEAMNASGINKDITTMLNGNTIEDAINSIRSFPPTFYVLMIINTCLVWSPIIALIIAILTKRGVRKY